MTIKTLKNKKRCDLLIGKEALDHSFESANVFIFYCLDEIWQSIPVLDSIGIEGTGCCPLYLRNIEAINTEPCAIGMNFGYFCKIID